MVEAVDLQSGQSPPECVGHRSEVSLRQEEHWRVMATVKRPVRVIRMVCVPVLVVPLVP